MTARSAADIRRGNLFEVLRRVSVGGPVSRQEIVTASSLSMATVASIVSELIALDLLTESETVRRATGRPLTRLTVNPAFGLFIGVDVAETYIHAALFDAALDARADERVAVVEPVGDPAGVVQQIAELVRLLSDRANGDQVRGVGICVPGLVDDADGVSVFAPNWAWRQVPVRRMLAEQFNHPVHLDNPLRALVVSELWREPGLGGKNLAVVNLGTGVGAGLAFGGDLYRGTSNSAGEWGHTTVVLDGWACRCGSSGCVEAYVGAPGLLRHLQEADPRHRALRLGQTEAITELARSFAAGDPAAIAAVHAGGRYLGAGLGSLVNVVNPDAVVLVGWVSDLLGDALLAAARRDAESHALVRPLAAVEFSVRSGTGNPVARGAATFALEAALTHDHTEGTR
ncbi:ROK family protein [Terrabacter sp. GCM10028922]|uniref:ROK family protein n=1 Tax=Terrabacter sp. GCM10028922 TaxID=3273428 RepID=UPI00361E1F2D